MRPKALSVMTLFARWWFRFWAAAHARQRIEGATSTDTSATTNPVPLINQPLVPDAAKPGGTAFPLIVNGTGFVSGSVVKWNGSSRTATFVRSSQLKASILASDIAKPGTGSVTVVNPSPGGGTSNVVFLEATTTSSSIAANLSEFGSGQGADWVSAADFNRDGKRDLAVAECGNNNVSILLSNGDGTFQAGVNYAVGTYPTSEAVGDFNGDGKLDLATTNFYSNNISVLLGNGDGTFQAAVEYSAGNSPFSLAIGDFNRDGKLDLAVANEGYEDNVSVLMGNRDGTFRASVKIPSRSGLLP